MCLATLASCGKSGNDSGSSGGDSASTSKGDINSGQLTITGKFVKDTDQSPLEGHWLWILNHTDQFVKSYDLDDEGSTEISIDEFDADSSYSFHLLTSDYQLVTSLDFDPLTDGKQAGVNFSGGLGFDMGTVEIQTDKIGQIDFQNVTGDANLGGAFEVNESVSLASFPTGELLSSATLSSQLVPSNAQEVLNGFYLASTFPQAYIEALSANSKLFAQIQTSSSENNFHIATYRAGSWLLGSRISSSDEAHINDASLWSSNQFTWSQTTSSLYEAHIFPGKALRPGSIIVANIKPLDSDDEAEFIFPFSTSDTLRSIPKVSSISLDGSSQSTINYSSTQENGLSRPFCNQGSDIELTLDNPKDFYDNTLSGSAFDNIVANFTFYKMDEGIDVKTNPVASDFPAPYQQNSSFNLGSYAASWRVDLSSLSLTIPNANLEQTSHELSIPNELLLSNAAGESVSKVKIQLIYGNSSTQLKAATLLFIDMQCSD